MRFPEIAAPAFICTKPQTKALGWLYLFSGYGWFAQNRVENTNGPSSGRAAHSLFATQRRTTNWVQYFMVQQRRRAGSAVRAGPKIDHESLTYPSHIAVSIIPGRYLQYRVLHQLLIVEEVNNWWRLDIVS